MKKKGGSQEYCPSSSSNDTSLVIPSSTFGFKHGSDPMSNSHGFLKHKAGQQNRLNNLHRGGYQSAGEGCCASENVLTVPQFNQVNPSGPNGPNSSSTRTGSVHAKTKVNAEFDHYAHIKGGYTRKQRKTKRKYLRRRKSLKKKSRKKSYKKHIKKKNRRRTKKIN